jgi:uncharacterized coiled-coil protein SlyX
MTTQKNGSSKTKAEPTAAEKIEQKCLELTARANDRIEELDKRIAHHERYIEKAKEKQNNILAYLETRIRSVREKGDPRQKKVSQIEKLKAKMAELQAEIDSM